MHHQEFVLLMENYYAAKSRMTRGIIFLAVSYALLFVGLFFYVIGIYLWPLLLFAIPTLLACIPFEVIGLVFLISGIIRRVKANRNISRFKKSAECNSNP